MNKTVEQFVNLYKNGMSSGKIAEKFNCSGQCYWSLPDILLLLFNQESVDAYWVRHSVQ